MSLPTRTGSKYVLSMHSANNLAKLLGSEVELLGGVKVASIGPVTSGTVRELGLPLEAEAGESTVEGLVAAILARQSG